MIIIHSILAFTCLAFTYTMSIRIGKLHWLLPKHTKPLLMGTMLIRKIRINGGDQVRWYTMLSPLHVFALYAPLVSNMFCNGVFFATWKVLE